MEILEPENPEDFNSDTRKEFSQAELDLLDERLAEMDDNPDAGIPLDVFMKQMRQFSAAKP